ncbi:hypothetical protein CVG87_18060 [Pseudomonas sp. WCS365]|nr:hypothetical protein CVG87_18060 [Pseudomonas sp. WCS365]
MLAMAVDQATSIKTVSSFIASKLCSHRCAPTGVFPQECSHLLFCAGLRFSASRATLPETAPRPPSG